jgi:hypothetical protein
MSPVTVRFRTNYREMYHALRAIDGAIPRIRLLRRITLCLLPIGLLLLAAATFSEDPPSILIIVGGIMALVAPTVVFVLAWTLPAYIVWLSLRQSEVWSAEHELVFTDAGISGSSAAPSFGAFIRWEAVVRVVETSRFLLYFGSDQAATFIPKRALPDKGAVQTLASLMRERAGKPDTTAGHVVPVPAFPSTARVVCTFNRDSAELARAATLVSRQSGALWPSYAAMIGLGAWSMGPRVSREWTEGGWAAINLPMALLALAPLLILVALNQLVVRFFARRHVRSSPAAVGPQTIRLHDEGISSQGALYNTDVKWTALLKVVETREFFLFFLGKAHAYYLPKRALQGEDIVPARELIATQMTGRAKLLQA